MGNIFTDIVEEVEIKPSKSKIILKWTVRIAILLIGLAFTYGQLKTSNLVKRNELEATLNENTKAIEELKSETRDGFNQVNGRIDKVYDDGFDAFNKFQEYNRKQFEIIIDYGNQDKAMLKRILELSATEQARTIENNIYRAKRDTLYAPSIRATQIIPKDK